MATSNTNPFVLPGLGQDGNLAGNPLLASMEMMSKAWSGLATPGGLAPSLSMTPPMSVDELDRRIAELRTVENWLRMNLSMLSSAIQGMEVQRSTIATLRSFVAGATGSDPSPLEVVLGLKPAANPGSGTSAPADETASASSRGQPDASAAEASAAGHSTASPTAEADASVADQMSQAAQSASQAWWNLLQQQFNQIATATASTMPDPAAMQAAAEAAARAVQPETSAAPDAATAKPASAPRKRAPRKTAAKRASAARKS